MFPPQSVNMTNFGWLIFFRLTLDFAIVGGGASADQQLLASIRATQSEKYPLLFPVTFPPIRFRKKFNRSKFN